MTHRPNPDPTLATLARGEQPPPTKVHAIRQVGEWLEVEPGLADGRSVQSGLLTSLWAASPRLFRVGPDIDRGPVSLDATAQFRVLPSSGLELRTDRSTVGLRSLTLPAWASAIGRDPAGLWVEMTIKGVVSRMRWIPPGRFLMGSPVTEKGRWNDEGPQHEVVMSRGYWLGETPVTQALWQAVMDDDPSKFKGPTRPVEQVSWEDAQRFMAVLNEPIESTDGDEEASEADGEYFRLPSEAEWEYACRAGTIGATYVGGREAALDVIAWWSGNSEGETHPVRLKQPNAWGLHDMLGNVLEWCMDASQDYSADSSVLVDPMTVGSQGDHRVCRGGGWDRDAGYVRAAYRVAYRPVYRYDDLGFRLARGQGYQGPEGVAPGGR
jgi:formylglycine-generating enzyme required for sulfatase activity